MKIWVHSLHIFITLIACSMRAQEISFVKYTGGRPGYSSVSLKLFSDSTYGYYEWIHTMHTLRDKGKWRNAGTYFTLYSTEKTKWKKGKKETSRGALHFRGQQFALSGDTLLLIPKESKDDDFYRVYYTLYKAGTDDNKR